MRSLACIIPGLALAVIICSGATTLALPDIREDPIIDGKKLSAWIAELQDKDVAVRRKAAAAIEKLPLALSSDKFASGSEVEELEKRVQNKAYYGGAQLAEKSEVALARALLAALKDEDTTVRLGAAMSLAATRWQQPMKRLSDQEKAEVQAVLLDELKNPDALIRRKAAARLPIFGIDQKTALAPLAGLLKDPDEKVRISAAGALGHMSPPEAAVSALSGAMADKDAYLRAAALTSLGRVGVQREGVVPVVTRALRDDDPTVRRLAVDLAGQIAWRPSGPNPAKEVVPVLLELAQDKNYPSRSAVIQAIGRIRPDHAIAVPVVTECLKEADTRAVAAQTLQGYGNEAKLAVPILREAAKAGDEADIVVALIRIDPDADETWVAFRTLPARGRHSRKAAVSALLRMDRQGKDPATMKALTSLLEDKDPKVKQDGVFMVRWQSSPEVRKAALPHLIEFLKSGAVPAAEVAEVLSDMKTEDLKDAKAVVPELLKALEREKDDEARQAILDALKKIDPQAVKKLGKP